MARAAKLKKKKSGRYEYWYTEAGGSPMRFGRVDEVPHAQANREFLRHVAALADVDRRQGRAVAYTYGELVAKFLDEKRDTVAATNFKNYQYRLGRLKKWRVRRGLAGAGQALGELKADRVTPKHIEAGLATFDDCGPQTRDYYRTHVVSLYRWANRSGFARIELAFSRESSGVSQLNEHDLLTPKEIKAIYQHADDDLTARGLRGVSTNGNRFEAKIRVRGKLHYLGLYKTANEAHEAWREAWVDHCGVDPPTTNFSDVVRLYELTGARTDELPSARVRDFDGKQIVLRKWKNSRKTGKVRQIVLVDRALAIVEQLCEGKGRDEPILTDPQGKPWRTGPIQKRFAKVRDRAGVREHQTIYSFRHLYITNAINKGVAWEQIAKLCGTSYQMIDRVYGHWRTDDLVAVQKELAK